MAKPQECYALTTYFTQGYVGRYSTKPVINGFKARYGFDALLSVDTSAEIKEVIDYYLGVDTTHSIDKFFSAYDKIKQQMIDDAEAEARQKALLEASRKRAEEWVKSGKRRITSD